MDLEKPLRFNANPESSPEIEKPVDEMMELLKEIQEGKDHGPGKAYQQASAWLPELQGQARRSGDIHDRNKVLDFCLQCEETLEFLTNGPKGNPLELPEQQQILAAAAYEYHLNGNKRYLDYYKDWMENHHGPKEDKGYTDPPMKEFRQSKNDEELIENLRKYTEIWDKDDGENPVTK